MAKKKKPAGKSKPKPKKKLAPEKRKKIAKQPTLTGMGKVRIKALDDLHDTLAELCETRIETSNSIEEVKKNILRELKRHNKDTWTRSGYTSILTHGEDGLRINKTAKEKQTDEDDDERVSDVAPEPVTDVLAPPALDDNWDDDEASGE